MEGNDYRSGIDVSHWQGKVNWTAVGEDGSIDFAFAKATEGATGRDPRFKENFQGMRLQNITRGAYHVVTVTSTPQDQANHIVDVLKSVGFNHSTDDFALSTARGNNLTSTGFANFIKELFGNLSYPLIKEQVKLYGSFFQLDALANSGVYDFSKHKLWMADWKSKDQPRLPGNWSTWSIWHYTNKGKVAGIQGDVNLDRMHPLSTLVETSLGNLSGDPSTASPIPAVEHTTTVQPHAAVNNTGHSQEGSLGPLARLLRSGVNWIASFFQSTPGSETMAVQSVLQNELQGGKEIRVLINAINNGSAQGVLSQQLSDPVNHYNTSVTAGVGGSHFVNTTLQLGAG